MTEGVRQGRASERANKPATPPKRRFGLCLIGAPRQPRQGSTLTRRGVSGSALRGRGQTAADALDQWLLTGAGHQVLAVLPMEGQRFRIFSRKFRAVEVSGHRHAEPL